MLFHLFLPHGFKGYPRLIVEICIRSNQSLTHRFPKNRTFLWVSICFSVLQLALLNQASTNAKSNSLYPNHVSPSPLSPKSFCLINNKLCWCGILAVFCSDFMFTWRSKSLVTGIKTSIVLTTKSLASLLKTSVANFSFRQCSLFSSSTFILEYGRYYELLRCRLPG